MTHFNFRFALNTFIAVLLFLSATGPLQAADTTKVTIGEEYWHNSKLLGAARKYQVSLPERYEGNSRKYPSLYIIDSDFHFLHVASSIKHLTRMGKLPPMIVVGVATLSDFDYVYHTTWQHSNPKEQSAEYGGIKTFNNYISNELIPIIDKAFRTNNQRAVAGYSLGGLFVLNNYLDSTSKFNAFLAMSPSVWFDNMSIVQRFKQIPTISRDVSNLDKAGNKRLFISVANEQGMGVAELVTAIKPKFKDNSNWAFVSIPEENHFSTALPALLKGLEFLAPNYGMDAGELLALGDYNAALNYFESLQQQWGGFQIEWLQAYQFAKYVFWSEQTNKIGEILKSIQSRFPDAHAQIAIQLANGWLKKNQLEKADALIAQVKLAAKKMPEWYKAKADLLTAQGKPELAKALYLRANELAKQSKWSAWEVNGLKP
ncbi:alpha/beta hydrolase-fold protein [Psychrosphaera aestuarii]|uniref:alpha/beta hydrolase-fold protein n=1 Tax=Psychrosphaera aestuarii TaxID=1266052 RepID=UPI001B32F006|nr:alpha/beta hydrolase-fold protein [Psychrosphaera aestuarii]